MTFTEFSSLLQCPDCGEKLGYEQIEQSKAAAGNCGLLHCSCFDYPVLDDVPILTKERLAHKSIGDARVVAGGPLPEELSSLIVAGRALEGLVDLLTFPVCPWPLNRVGAFRRLSLRPPHYTLGLAYRRRKIRSMLERREELTAEDWLSTFYWHAPAPFDPFNYFFFRFAQPRHLATLSLLSILPAEDAPLLDLACGYGHFLHAVTSGGQPGIGLDQNFHQMWVARHYIAPSAAFACADAERSLPLLDATCSAALCADAFQIFADKPARVAELSRCTGDGPIILACVTNLLVDPTEPAALTPTEYADLFAGFQWRGLTEDDILARYLDRLGPDLRTSSAQEAMEASPWLHYVVAKDEVLFSEHGMFDKWPHATGNVGVNPIYDESGDDLVFHFPSPWYTTENGRMREYMPDFASARDDRETLLARCVFVGLPEKYVRSAGRPWPQAANRRLLALIQGSPTT